MLRLLLSTVIIVPASLILASCGASQTDVPQVPPGLAEQLPPLPVDRRASEVSGTTIEGDQAYDMSLNAAVAGTDLDLQSSLGNLSWGIWRLQPGDDELLGVEVLLSTNGDDEAWMAVSNYTLGRWELNGPLTASQEFSLSDANHRSPAGNCFIAVITSNGNGALVNRLVMTENRVGWQVVTVDTTGFSGEQASLAVIDGKPAISYYDFSAAQALKFIRSATTTGADPEDWGEPTIIDSEWIAFSDMAEVEGHPAVCFWRSGYLVYAWSTTVDGGDPGDWNIVGVDGDGNAGHHCSLEVVAGNPAISYHNFPEEHVSSLRYARSSTPTGDGLGDWTQVFTVDSGDETGHYTSLAIVDGNPAISYYDQTNSLLKYVRSTTESGANQADWSQFATVKSVQYDSVYTSLAVVDGNPAISYWDSKEDDLRYIRSVTVDGADSADWQQDVEVHADVRPIGLGVNTSLAVIDGRPAIAYPRSGDGIALMLATASSATGSDAADWTDKQVADADGYVGTHCSLASVGGRPAIAYYDEINYHLKYAIRFE